MTLRPAHIKKLPDAPGIYLFYNTKGILLYVGKATSLRDRVNSYFIGKRKTSRPIEELIHHVARIAHKQTDSVLEAVILEANYIRKYKPRYNVLGKDDKSWNYIVITKDPFPLVETLRQHEFVLLKSKNTKAFKRLAYVFGPYPGLNSKAAIKILRGLFRFSNCQKSFSPRSKKQKSCLYYQMGECLGVCTGEIRSQEYAERVIRPLVSFLKGRKKYLVFSLEKKMRSAARQQDFEEATRIRDQIVSLRRIQDISLLNTYFFNEPAGEIGSSSIERIEGYDISNLGSVDKVGSMVVFNSLHALRSDYRRFKIKGVSGQNDLACLAEVLERRLTHAEWPLPHLFLVDGGLPQVNVASRVLKKNKVSIPIIGIAKGPDRKKNEFIIKTKDRELIKWIAAHKLLLIRVRDEAHRFAIQYQRKLRQI